MKLGAVALVLGGAIAAALLLTGGTPRRTRAAPPSVRPAAAPAPALPPASPPRPFTVGLRVLRFVDRTRRVRYRNGTTSPRTLVTDVRYPASGAGPYPLVVFAHGFNLVPGTYRRLLNSLAAAGYVVAAPAFPLERANAPGGPDESDIVNQPRDVSVVISHMIGGPFRGLVDPHEIAVAGHSDGATTASAVGYEPGYRDGRVSAVVTLAGGWLGSSAERRLRGAAPPLLAVQGTADQVNPPSATYGFYAAARRPKYLLRLLGAGHEDPFTVEQPQLRIVERAMVAFLDLYLERRPGAARRLAASGRVRGFARLTAEP